MSGGSVINVQLTKVAAAWRAAFFAEFGEPENLSPAEINDMLSGFLVLTAGELIEAAARFKRDDMSIREFVMQLVDGMIAENIDVILKLKGLDDKVAYLRNDGTKT